jgi:hypothetical protein
VKPRIIHPLTSEESAAFDLVQAVLRRDLHDPFVKIELFNSSAFFQVCFGDPADGAIRTVAGNTMAEAFEYARAIRRGGV